MRHTQTRQQQINDTEQPFAQYKTTRQHDNRRLAPPLPSAPPQTNQPANGARKRKRRRVVHA
jgi:hypothetical protein